ncbi:MAG: DEAD/DEAH box helicase [Clostridiales Family XIII bacterium]|jgi:superfamily II DNA or RNA helicase|nr:DEAD/DEAH box helicase [Clostridiales Family XIII bacterium]
MTINIDKIVGLADRESIALGIRLFSERKVEADIDKRTGRDVSATVLGDGDKSYYVNLSFPKGLGGDIGAAVCTCPKSVKKYGYCEHIVAVYLEVQDANINAELGEAGTDGGPPDAHSRGEDHERGGEGDSGGKEPDRDGGNHGGNQNGEPMDAHSGGQDKEYGQEYGEEHGEEHEYNNDWYDGEYDEEYDDDDDDDDYRGSYSLASQRGGDVFTARPRGTDYSALMMIREYALRAANRAAAPKTAGERAALQATLHMAKADDFWLTFKAGSKRLYVLQNLVTFHDGFQKSEVLKLGKNYSLLLGRTAFEEDSLPLLDFFFAYYRNPFYSSRYRANYQKNMELTPNALDAFFELLLTENVSAELAFMDGVHSILDQDCPVKIRLAAADTGAELSCPDYYQLLCGYRHLYVIHKNNIYRCSEAYKKACYPLLQAMARGAVIFLAEKELAALFAAVIKTAEVFLEIEVDPDLAGFAPPPLVSKVYFDVAGDPDGNGVIAHASFSYDGKSHDAFETKLLTQSFDIAGEMFLENLLISYMGKLKISPGTLLLKDDDAVYELAVRGLTEIAQFAEVYISDEFNKISVRPPAVVSVGVKVNGRLLEVDFDVEGLDFSELVGVLGSYRRARKYHRLKDGSFLPLEDDAILQLSELADGLDLSEGALASGRAQLDANRALYIDTIMKQHEELRYERDAAFRNIIRNMKDVADADFRIPDDMNKTLRNYQKTGYRWLRTLEMMSLGGILADDMGLGKTIQVLALLQAKKDESDQALPTIVVCPSSLVLNWESESGKFTPNLRVLAMTGGAAERREAIKQVSSYDLLITSYDQLKRDIALYENTAFDFAVLDEAQFIKNHNTQNAKSVKKLKANTRLALTGTPVENSLAELWSIFDFMMPGYLYSYHHFRKKFETQIVKYREEKATERLRALVRPFILRRLKKDVLKELPEKTESVLLSPMGEEQRKIYLATLAQVKKELAEKLEEAGEAQGRIVVLAALTRLRQICCDPALLYEDYRGGSVKSDACMELLESMIDSGHRALLFSQFTSMMSLLEKRFAEKGIRYYRLDGSTPKTERQFLVNEFNSDDTSVFLISLRAGGTGLNLTGADVVIHYDPWWNISVQNQATDRAHRIGQVNKVQVYKLIAKDTIEERILKLQDQKASLAESIIQKGGNAFDALSKDELLSLFEER